MNKLLDKEDILFVIMSLVMAVGSWILMIIIN